AVGWAGLLLYGAAIGGGAAEPTVWIAAAVTAYVLLVNGVHGALRDLTNDTACGARTTAMLLGARVVAGVLRVPRALIVYTLCLHGMLFAAAFGAWRVTEPLHDGAAAASFGLLLAVMLSSLALLGQAARARGDPSRARSAATWHLFACMA